MTTRTPTDSAEPASAFSFKMIVEGLSNSSVSFQEARGIESQPETEETVEGGENRFVHRLPAAVKQPRLVLKRGITSVNSPLMGWCRSVLESSLDTPITTKRISVYLLDHDQRTLRGWSFADAWPVRWEAGNLDRTNDRIALESIEFIFSASQALD